MKFQKEYYRTATNWESSLPDVDLQPTTAPSHAQIFYFQSYVETPVVNDGFIDIDDLVSKSEGISDRKAALEEARKWVAAEFYAKVPVSLALLRMAKGWSQKVLAEKLGTQQPYIARIESGTEDPRLSTIKKLAVALETDIQTISEALSNR